MGYSVTWHGAEPQNASRILSGGFKPGIKSGNSLGNMKWAGNKVYSSNQNVASKYGSRRIPIITPSNTRSMPGGVIGKQGFALGKEYAMSHDMATKGSNLASRIQGGAYPNSPTAQRMLAQMNAAPTTTTDYLAKNAARLSRFAGKGVPVLGNAFMVGDLAYQGTKYGLEKTGADQSLFDLGGTIYNWTHKG